MIKVVAAAANVDGNPEEEESNFFEIFIASADFDDDRHEIAEDFFITEKRWMTSNSSMKNPGCCQGIFWN